MSTDQHCICTKKFWGRPVNLAQNSNKIIHFRKILTATTLCYVEGNFVTFLKNILVGQRRSTNDTNLNGLADNLGGSYLLNDLSGTEEGFLKYTK